VYRTNWAEWPYRSAEGRNEGPKGEVTDFIAFVFAVIFLFPDLAQKSRVKPQNHLNQTNKKGSS
jgi:hypothetical protein